MTQTRDKPMEWQQVIHVEGNGNILMPATQNDDPRKTRDESTTTTRTLHPDAKMRATREAKTPGCGHKASPRWARAAQTVVRPAQCVRANDSRRRRSRRPPNAKRQRRRSPAPSVGVAQAQKSYGQRARLAQIRWSSRWRIQPQIPDPAVRGLSGRHDDLDPATSGARDPNVRQRDRPRAPVQAVDRRVDAAEAPNLDDGAQRSDSYL